MWTSQIVKAEPSGDPRPRLETVGVSLQIDLLVFERAPEPLDEDVVHPSAPSIHRNAHAGRCERAGELARGELAALVGVEDFGLAEPCQRLLQGGNTERHVHRVRQAKPAPSGCTNP